MKLRPLYIDVEVLKRNNACFPELRKYKKVFGENKVMLTRANWNKARKAGLQTWWLALMFTQKYGGDKDIEKVVRIDNDGWEVVQELRKRVAKHDMEWLYDIDTTKSFDIQW